MLELYVRRFVMRSREHFTHQLEALHTELYTLGELVVVAITRAVDALTIQDVTAARSIVGDDQRIDRAQYALEEQAVAIIATQQPVASDLRRLIAVIAIASELERIADYAKGMAKLTIRDAERPQVPIPDGLMQMAKQARAMLTSALAAFIQQDATAARRLGAADDRVDALNKRVESELLDLLRHSPASTERVADLLFVAHNLERIADRTTNIAERVVYMVHGDVVALNL
jgi:phosphate transport system protein